MPRTRAQHLHGADVANLVQAVTDHASAHSYRQRKQVLREQVRSAGGEAALLFAADKISKLRGLPQQIRRDRSRFGATARATWARSQLERIAIRRDAMRGDAMSTSREAPGLESHAL